MISTPGVNVTVCYSTFLTLPHLLLSFRFFALYRVTFNNIWTMRMKLLPSAVSHTCSHTSRLDYIYIRGDCRNGPRVTTQSVSFLLCVLHCGL